MDTNGDKHAGLVISQQRLKRLPAGGGTFCAGVGGGGAEGFAAGSFSSGRDTLGIKYVKIKNQDNTVVK